MGRARVLHYEALYKGEATPHFNTTLLYTNSIASEALSRFQKIQVSNSEVLQSEKFQFLFKTSTLQISSLQIIKFIKSSSHKIIKSPRFQSQVLISRESVVFTRRVERSYNTYPGTSSKPSEANQGRRIRG